MKKIILLLFTLTTLTNVSYSSFPIPIQPVIHIDTIIADTNKIMVKETTSDYHSRMQKEGFDIDNCMCIDCRNNPTNLSKEVNGNTSLLGTLLLWLWLLGIILGVILIQWVIRGFIAFNAGPVIG